MTITPTAVQQPAPAPAMLFLYQRTVRNRLRQQLARAKSPRYLAAVVMGMLYIWWALFRNSRLGGGPLAKIVETDVAVPIASALMLLSAARWWVFGGERSALAFTPAEVQFLFPAPVSRRQLVHAKLVRMQLAILLNTFIFSVLLRGSGGTVEGWQRGLSLWMLFSSLALHRLGASIVHANAMEHVGKARRRLILPLIVFGAVLVAVIYGVVTAWPLLKVASLSGTKAVLLAVTDALRTPVPAAALWPVRAVLEPVFLGSGAKWLAAMPWAAAMLLLHYFWVVRLDKAFEEAALEATQHRAERLHRFRTSQMGNSRSRKGKLAKVPSLALTGRPEMAIAWKNVVAALRGGAWRTQLLTFTVGLAVLAAVTRSASDRAGDVFMGVTFGWGAMLLFIGPLWMRFDLRLDLPRLAMLKTMPLPGWRIVAAEIAAVTTLHSITVWSLMVVPLVMFLQEPAMLAESGATIPIIVSVIVGVPIFNALMFTIQNGTALLFPAWVRLGTEARGFETMGQNLLTTGATTLVAAIALVFPVGLGGLVLWFTNDWGGWSVLVATVLACAVVVAELWPILFWLGGVFEKIDVSEVAAST
ncbi:putative ABC exporter domain-containing protein [Gemmatimonas sp.]|uniref:putative ABC exporter domain-containing protein n=1 Tax=Gemmatimonas sp. TaxID=1962908 RepID=UPI00286B2DA7|nr:putative ABC exporter domain-containing protein [Gemmatimonas sp.]